MKNYSTFLKENIGKFITVDYKIIKNDIKGKPTLLIDDFKLIKSEDNKNYIKAKGYILSSVDGSRRKSWFAFDDFEKNNTRMVWSKDFENGTKRIKVVL